MSSGEYLYLIKTINDNKIQLVTHVDVNDGVVCSNGDICAVLKRYEQPVDMLSALKDVNKFTSEQVLTAKNGDGVKGPKGKPCIDYLGTHFDNIYQMCSHYGITETKYRSRLSNGWTQKEALTGIREKSKVTDHLGNVFNSKAEMCQQYNIPVSRYDARINAGRTIEEALFGIPGKEKLLIEDHLGNKYVNTSQMCKAYGIRMDLYCQRKKRGWTLEEILLGKKSSSNSVFDHNGKEYLDMEEMCKEYDVSTTNYLNRIKYGWTVEEALTGIHKKNLVNDHLGNIFLSQKDMCDSYGIKYQTFQVRIRNGWTLERALTVDTTRNPMKNKMVVTSHINRSLEPDNSITDHNGTIFATLKEMCDAYNIRVDTYKYRIKQGLSIEEALTKSPSRVTTNQSCQDHLGNHYESMAEMYRAYGIRKDVFIHRRKIGWPLEKILTTGVNESRAIIIDGEKYLSKKDYCRQNNVNYENFVRQHKLERSIDQATTADTRSYKNLSISDHNGIHYSTLHAMCKAYNMTCATFRYRKKKGWDLEAILTRPKGLRVEPLLKPPKNMARVCYDHNGKRYPSKKSMCKAFGVSYHVFASMLKEGYSLEVALQGRKKGEYRYARKDHLDNEYSNLKAMCDAYNISVHTYQKRMSKGYSIEKALTTEEISEVVRDHLGNTYDTINEMCAKYGISASLFYSRIRRGKAIIEALTTPKEDLGVEYKGKKYLSHKDLAADYGINYGTFLSRIQHGWTLNEAVIGIKKTRACYDHLGAEYPSQKIMCHNYGVSSESYHSRIKSGWTIEQALSNNPPQKTKTLRKRHDHLGNEYPDLESLCKAYDISVHDYQKRLTKGYNLEEVLTSKEPQSAILDHLGNKYETVKDMCRFYGISPERFYSRIRSGKTLEETLTQQKRSTKVEYHGKQYASLVAMAENKGIKPSVLKRRLALGWTLDEAISGIKKSRQALDHRGKVYPSIKKMCAIYKISPSVYFGRIKNGWTVQQALTVPVKTRSKS